MEEDVSGASFSEIDLEAPQSNYTQYLDAICPLFMLYGMSRDEFWHGSLDALYDYWQEHQYEVEQRNQELWLQAAYIREAIASCFDKKAKFPDKPYRITAMSEMEKEAENKRKVEDMRERLNEIKRRWDSKHKGAN